jgi:glucose-6-phosphate isomerase
MNFENIFYNVDFLKDIESNTENTKLISSIQETLSSLPALNILKDKSLLQDTIKKVNLFSKGKKNFLVLGTGGSNLGARALVNILNGSEKYQINFFDNIDPIKFKNDINKINLNESGFIVISKSGNTPETLTQLSCLIEIFSQKNNLDQFYRNTLFITEEKLSPLRNIAYNNNSNILIHNKDIGGRYSVFSNVGMVPAILAGLNVEEIRLGALKEFNKYLGNDHLKIATFFRNQNINKKIQNSIIMTYSDALFYFGKWYLQLWSESLGKQKKGITPIHSVGTTDQHSQLQLYLDGPNDKFFTFITTNHSNKGLSIHKNTMLENNIEYLSDKTMGDLMQAEQQATIDTFISNKFLLREIRIQKIDEFSIGQLMAFSIMETVATCLYFEVNPFNQPAVEQGKILTKKYLS